MYAKEYYGNISILQSTDLITEELESIRQEGTYMFFCFTTEKARKVYIEKAKRFITFIAPVDYVFDEYGGHITNIYEEKEKKPTLWERIKKWVKR